MKGFAVDAKLKLIQVFLSNGKSSGPLVSEVSINLDTKKLFCTCPGFSGRSYCKHVQFVKARTDSDNQTYPMELSSEATDEEISAAECSIDGFRELVIRHGKIEIL
jgi:hypothetical protein